MFPRNWAKAWSRGAASAKKVEELGVSQAAPLTGVVARLEISYFWLQTKREAVHSRHILKISRTLSPTWLWGAVSGVVIFNNPWGLPGLAIPIGGRLKSQKVSSAYGA